MNIQRFNREATLRGGLLAILLVAAGLGGCGGGDNLHIPPPTATVAIASTVVAANAAITPFAPVTAGSGMQPYTYGVSPALPSGLSLDTSTGIISGTPALAQAQATYTVGVTDSQNVSASNTFTLTITPALTAATAVATTVASTNVAITPFTPITAANGTAPYTYSVAPALPAGLSMSNSTGAISGAPTVGLSQTTFTVTVKDAKAVTASSTFALTVIVPAAPLTATANAAAPTTLPVGLPLTPFTPVTGAGGTAPLTYTASPALPAGLIMDGTTGVVSGTPSTASAQTTYTVTVTDTAAKSASGTFNLTVQAGQFAAAAVAPTIAIGPNATLASVMPVIATGGTPPYTYTLGGAAPALSMTGLTYDSATGTLGGTTAAVVASATYTVTVTDATSAVATSGFQVTNLPSGYLLFNGQTWMVPDATKTYSHADALTVCAGTINGTSGWHLPTAAEMQAMLTAQAALVTSNGFLKGVGWPVSSSFYWSADPGTGANFYYVNFGTNSTKAVAGTNLYYVTCAK
ncbi:MAG TPA: putative Ig domain-containing protein [Burkholderiaceae bacterium]|jgi:hypothetical protein